VLRVEKLRDFEAMTNRTRQSAKEAKEVEAKAQAYIATPRMLQLSMETGADVTLTSAEAAIVYRLEGIVSKRLGSRYRSGRSPDSLKFKNPNAPAVKREAEEDWGRERWR
jgi:hypothetical protein